MVCCCIHSNIQSQSISSSPRQSLYTYVYRLKANETKDLLSYRFDDHILLKRQPLDSFKTYTHYSGELPSGNYLYLRAEGDDLRYFLVYNTGLRADLLNNGRDVMIKVIDQMTGKPIVDANVLIGRKKVPYNSVQQVYFLPNSNRQGIVTIIHGNDTTFSRLRRDMYNPAFVRLLRKIIFTKPLNYAIFPFRKLYWGIREYGFGYGITYPFRRSRYNDFANGFMVFNKPKYLPGDTVKWKAFILKGNEKPLNRKMVVSMEARYHGKEKEIATLKPISKGAYVHEFLLKDSLKLNTWYDISLKKKGHQKIMMEGSFYLEDYQLDETSYSLSSKEKNFYYGDSLEFSVTGKDANGMNLLDSKVEVEVVAADILKYHENRVFVPNILWSSSKMLEPFGATTFRLASDALPAADLNLRITATFRNSNNELHKESTNVKYLGNKEGIKTRVDADTVEADFLDRGIEAKAEGKLIILCRNDTLLKKAITFPFKEIINNAASRYVFTSKTARAELDLHNESSLIDIWYSRNNDSLYVEVVNPRNLDFTYFIYKGKTEKLLEGQARTFKWTQHLPGKESYFVEVFHTWAGRVEKESRAMHLYENNLNVSLDQPAVVYPGEKVKIKVKVTDYKDHPVSDVNLTASAVNAQFKNVDLPDVPYLGKGHWSLVVNNRFYLDRPDVNRLYKLSKHWADKLHLTANPYYKLHFPDSNRCELYDSISSSSAQFSPYVFKYGFRESVYLIYLDNEPVYYFDLSPTGPYAFKGSAGYHNLRIRLWDREIKLDSVLLIKGKKLELSIELSKLPVAAITRKQRWYLGQEDIDRLNAKVIWVNNNFKNRVAYLWQKDQVVKLGMNSNWNYHAGFFAYDSMHFALKNGFQTDFIFEPGYEYTIEDKLIKMRQKSYNLIRPNLSYNITNPPIGEHALELTDIQLKSLPERRIKLYEINPPGTNKGNGSFLLDYTGDSLVTRVVIYSFTSDFTPRFYWGKPVKYHDLPPGCYNFLLQTASGNYLQLDSVHILADGMLFQRINDLKYNTVSERIKDSLSRFESNWTTEIPVRKVGVDKTFSAYYFGGNSGAIKGKVFDKETQEAIPFANVIIEINNEMLAGTTSDFDGNFTIKPISPGKYDLKVTYIGYKTVLVKGIVVNADKITFQDLGMEATSVSLQEIMITDYKVPLIAKDKTSTGGTMTASEIAKMPNRSADAIATTVGGVFSADGERGSVRGQRAEGTVMYIDGIRVRGSNSLPMCASSYVSYADEVTKAELEIPQSAIRTNFNDCGYWMPNQYTDKNGEANFEVRFPDNLTTWKSWVLAINDKRQTGFGSMETKARKSMVASLALPRFLVCNDLANIIGKSLNYSSKPQHVTTAFTINGKEVQSRTFILTTALIDSCKLTAGEDDSLTIRYSLNRDDGYFDGEERKIPIYPQGVEEARGEFRVFNNDTSVTIVLPADAKEISIYAQDNMLESMLKDLDALKNYPYWCMEQTASKMRAFLMERKISMSLGRTFRHDSEIRKLIARLEKGQHEDGSWGWWEHSDPNIWMSAYVVEALSSAVAQEFRVSFLEKGADFLAAHRNKCTTDELLRTLLALVKVQPQFVIANDLARLQKDSLNPYQKLQLIRLQQLSGSAVDLLKILALRKQTTFGSYFWGSETDPWYNNTTNSTLLAYQIIEAADSTHSALTAIGNYFLELKSGRKWYNTIIIADILSTILPMQVRNAKETIKPITMTLSEPVNQTFTKFPVILKKENHATSLQVVKSGSGPMFFTAFTKSWNVHPGIVDSIFEVRSWFEVEHMRVDSLSAGVETALIVEVNVKKSATYCMLEVPIPAGCSYGDNSSSANYREAHREYFRHKTSIFLEKLPIGKQVFRINLQPRFSGSYTLNPVKVEQMYFPTNYGRNELKSVSIH